MKAAEIYSELCQLRSSNGKYGKAPVQLEQEGVKKIDIKDNRADVISHIQYMGEDGGIVEEVITSYDHSRPFELRPDTNHFNISLFDETGKQVNENHYMQMDTM